VDRHVVVVVGGTPPERRVLAQLPARRVVVAADSGYDHAVALGIDVDVLVGDLDSISAAGLAAAERAGVAVERHPTSKDATDTELALLAALGRGATAITVVSGGGDRLDHLLGTLFALALPALHHLDVEAWVGPAHVVPVHGGRTTEIPARVDETVTLLPVGGDATGIVTEGLAYPLRAETLAAGTSRGVSNVVVRSPVRVTAATGSLLVIRPEALS
jgi:thiamine pyrophosphokinase